MYTIKHVADALGVTETTLRAWERRYGIVAPHRSDGGYRLYDETDVGTLRRMTALIVDGISPQQAARLILSDTDPGNSTGGAPSVDGTAMRAAPVDDTAPTDHPPAVAALLDAATEPDPERISAILDEVLAGASYEAVIDDILLASLAEAGRAWRAGRLSVTGEHLLSAAIHRRLGQLFEAAGRDPARAEVLIGTPPDSHHDLGALAFAVAARRAGLAIWYLGTGLPAADWSAAVRRHRPRWVVLTVHHTRDLAALGAVVAELRHPEHGDPQVTIGVGGNLQNRAPSGTVPLGHRVTEAARHLAGSP